MDTLELPPKPKRSRRTHSPELKAQVLNECDQPGASIASVAQRHNLNANLIHKWKRSVTPAPQNKPDFIPVPLPTHSAVPSAGQQVTFEMNDIKVHWPLSEIDQALPWLQGLLR
jgi:transposase